MKQISILSFLILHIFSCSSPKDEEHHIVLKHNPIHSEELLIGHGGFLIPYKEMIIGMEGSPSLAPFYCLKPNETPLKFYHFGNRGQGPNDFLHPFSFQLINDDLVGVVDMSANMYLEFRIPKENDEIEIIKRIKFDTTPFRMIKTAFDQHIGLSMQEGLFILVDSTGKAIKSFFEYPYRNKEERQLDNKHRAFAYQGSLSANPSKTKCVYTSMSGDIIHFYELENNNIKLITKIENEYPRYKNDSNAESSGVIFGSNNRIGHISSYATEDFVYTLFSGKKLEEPNSYEASILRVFDWKGMLKNEYKLDIPCSFLCVSEDESRLWAIATTPETSLVYFDLQNLSDNTSVNSLKQAHISQNHLPDNNLSYQIDSIKIITLFLDEMAIENNKTIGIPFNSQIRAIFSTDKNITLKDSVVSPNQSILKITIKKATHNVFNDTIFVTTDSIQYKIINKNLSQ